jgi:hypothetical protein
MQQTHTPRENTIRRDEALKARFKELHEVKRIRLDDCIAQLRQEFFLAEKTVWNVLRRD